MTPKEVAKALLDNDRVFIITPQMWKALLMVRALMGDN